jgi:hypothetical protein
MTLAGVFLIASAVVSPSNYVRQVGVLAFAVAALWFIASIVVSAQWRATRRNQSHDSA